MNSYIGKKTNALQLLSQIGMLPILPVRVKLCVASIATVPILLIGIDIAVMSLF